MCPHAKEYAPGGIVDPSVAGDTAAVPAAAVEDIGFLWLLEQLTLGNPHTRMVVYT